MSWIDEIVLKRRAQRSTVFIVATLDYTRIRNIRELDTEHIKALFGRDNWTKIEYNVLTGDVLKDGVRATYEYGPLQFITSQITRQPTFVIIHYIYDSSQARQLCNFLVHWTNDGNVYKAGSIIIVFCSSVELFPETVRKFCYTIEVVASTPEERKQKLIQIAKQIEEGVFYKYGKPIQLKITEEHIVASAGLDLHMLESATLESFFEKRTIDARYYTKYKIDFLKQYGVEYIEPSYGFEAVGGYKLLKEYIKNRIIKLIRHPEIAKKYSLTPPKGIIMFGPPGVGKTHFAKALAKEIGLPMIKIDPSTFLRGIVGETEARVKQITNLIESLSPAIAFIDERYIRG